MGKPIAPDKDIAFAFPDVCNTPAPGGTVPIPYPNVAQLGDATEVSKEPGRELLVGGHHVLLEGSKVSTSTGDEAGSAGGVKRGGTKGSCEITRASGSVFYGTPRKGVARFMDATEQNSGNATGFVLSADPTVLVGD